MKILLDHEDKYADVFENVDLGGDFDPETEHNPYMHITLHSIIESQLEKRSPIEAYQFYLAMLKRKCTRHEAIHLVYVRFFYKVLKYRGPIDMEGYKSLLKKYRNRKPRKVWALFDDAEEAGETDETEGSAFPVKLPGTRAAID